MVVAFLRIITQVEKVSTIRNDLIPIHSFGGGMKVYILDSNFTFWNKINRLELSLPILNYL